MGLVLWGVVADESGTLWKTAEVCYLFYHRYALVLQCLRLCTLLSIISICYAVCVISRYGCQLSSHHLFGIRANDVLP